MHTERSDKILKAFLARQFADAKKLADQSDIVELVPVEGLPPSRYLIKFNNLQYFSKTVASDKVHIIRNDVIVAISFPDDYLKSLADNLFLRIACLMNPDFFHPNVKQGFGWICLGQAFLPGTTLADLIYSIYEIVNFSNITVDERNAFNAEACAYFRNSPEILKCLERRPLRRKQINLKIKISSVKN